MAGDASHIYESLGANALISVAKAVAAYISGSGALLAETIHSVADTGNQLLLLLGVKRAQKAPDETHPLGYGRSVYFWSFMVAIMLFLGGGVFSLYEGIHHFRHPEPVGSIGIGVAVLIFAVSVEAWATVRNVIEINKRRGAKPFFSYLRQTKDSDLVVVFGENGAAVLGGVIALAAVLAAKATGDGRFDAIGGGVIGVTLLFVAVFLAVEIKSLLLGECADPEVAAAVGAAAAQDARIKKVFRVITVQEGPGTVVVALKLSCDASLTARDISGLIQDFEARLRKACPAAKWVFVEPDLS